jgi:hypothetical protein
MEAPLGADLGMPVAEHAAECHRVEPAMVLENQERRDVTHLAIGEGCARLGRQGQRAQNRCQGQHQELLSHGGGRYRWGQAVPEGVVPEDVPVDKGVRARIRTWLIYLRFATQLISALPCLTIWSVMILGAHPNFNAYAAYDRFNPSLDRAGQGAALSPSAHRGGRLRLWSFHETLHFNCATPGIIPRRNHTRPGLRGK